MHGCFEPRRGRKVRPGPIAGIGLPFNWEMQSCEAHAEPVTTDCSGGMYEVEFNILKTGKVRVEAMDPADARNVVIGPESDLDRLDSISKESSWTVISVKRVECPPET